jgi:hypothetical protein
MNGSEQNVMSIQAIILIYSSLYSAYLLKVDIYIMFYIVVSNLSILIKHKVRSRQGRVCISLFFFYIFFFTINIFNEIFIVVSRKTYVPVSTLA